MKVRPECYQINIDSFKIRLPLENVKIIDDELNQLLITINQETGAIIKEAIERTKYLEEVGIKTVFSIQSMYDIDSRSTTNYLTITVSSKILKYLYFEGITKDNLRVVYNNLMKYKVVIFTYDEFINAFVTDIDFKTDFYMNIKQFNQLKEYVKSATRLSDKLGRGFKSYDNQNNRGFQYATRRTATPTNPYIKVYCKDVEMESRSKEFYNEYLETFEITNLYRLEYTIKDSNHFKRYGLKNILSELLELPAQQKINILNDIWDLQVHKINLMRMKKIADDDRFTINELWKFNIEIHLKNGLSIMLIKKLLKQKIASEKTYYRHCKMIDDIHYKMIMHDEIVKNNGIDDILEKIGLIA